MYTCVSAFVSLGYLPGVGPCLAAVFSHRPRLVVVFSKPEMLFFVLANTRYCQSLQFWQLWCVCGST